MKKIISLILIAILCLGVLTSCAQLGGVVDSIKDKLGMGDEQPAEGPTLDEAAAYLHKIYKDKKENTAKDFDVVSQVSINGIIFPVTWTSDNDKVVIRESTKTGFYTVDLPDVNAEEFSYTLTATISNADGETASKSYTFKVPAIDNSGITSTPVEGVAYKLFLLQGNENRRYYALNTTQNNENKFINTTLNPKDGAEFFVEKVDGGYKVYTEVNGVKNYIYVNVTRTENEDGTVKYSKFIGFSTEEGTVLTYSEKMGGTWTATIHEMVWGIGTYNSFTTISVSEGSYFTPEKVGSSQFVMQFITAEYANTLEEDKLPDSPSDAEGILNQLYALADGEQAIGSFTLTGKITALDNYNNPTIVVEGFENMPVYCFKLAVENKVGDTITVTATTMKNYGGTYEFMNCTLVSGGSGEVTPPAGDGETSESAVLDLMGNANLVNGSAQQNVFAANGITFTNDKAASTSDLTVQTTYAQRAYAGSTIKIEYPGMTKIVITFDDYSPDGTKNYMSGMDGMVVEGATFSRNNDVLTITFAAATDVFQSTSLTSQVRIEKIEVFTGEVETPETPDDPKPETPAYTAPVAGQAYDLYMELPTGKVYFAGSLDAEKGTYLNTTADASAAVKIYFEEVTGGYNIYFMNGDVKTYINAEAYLKSNGYAGCHFTLGETATTVWTYDTTNGVLEVYGEIEGKSDTFFAGTYGTYSTVSLSGAYYKNQIASGTQFPARLELAEGGNQGGNTPVDPQPPVHQHNFVEGKCECGAEDPNYVPETPVEPEDGMFTIPQILASAEGTKVKFTGTVHSFYEDWSSYGNCSPYIVDENGNKVLVFRTTTRVYVGDVVTVEGTVTIYNTVAQIAKDGSVVTVTTTHTCSYSEATCEEGSACTSCGKAGATAALGHTAANADGKCDRCGLNLSVSYKESSLSFSSTANRTNFTSSNQTWEANGVKLINDQASSTSSVADYSNPARFYKSSKITVECANMTKIEFVCNSSSYATALQSSIASNANYTVTVSGSTVTVTFVEAVDSFVITSLTGGQVRMNSLTVTSVG